MIPQGFGRTDDPAVAANIASLVAKTGRSCGSCSLCCKVMPVPEIEKPADEWCKHCRPGKGGCSIHDTKPGVCAGWHCYWKTNSSLGEHWYPRISRMVLNLVPEEGGLVLYVVVDPSFPRKWREAPYFDDIMSMAMQWFNHVPDYLTKICVGSRTFFIAPNGEDVELGPDQGVWFKSDGSYEIVTRDELAAVLGNAP